MRAMFDRLPSFPRRSDLGAEKLLIGSSAVLALLLAFRLVGVQAGDSRKAVAASLRTKRLSGPPGRILDRDGRILAASVPAFDAWIDCFADRDLPKGLADEIVEALEYDRILDPKEKARIRRILQVPPPRRRFDRRVLGEKGKDLPRFVWTRVLARGLASKACLSRLERIGERSLPQGEEKLRFRIRIEPSWRRCYPLGRSASHVVGMRRRVGSGRRARLLTTGLEALPVLRGADEREFTVEYARGGGRGYWLARNPIPLLGDLGRSGVVTTLDADIQEEAWRVIHRAWKEAEADWGMTVLLDLRNGDVRALAGVPGFDPEHGRKGDSYYPVTHFARFEPGSVLKPLLVSLALEAGVVREDSIIRCEGDEGGDCLTLCLPGRRSRRVIRDDHHVGVVPLPEVLVQSSNIGAVRIGNLGGPALHRRLLKVFRLGSPPEIGLPLPLSTGKDGRRPVGGCIPGEGRFRNERNYRLWTGPSLSHGYELLVYPLTFAEAFASVVTGREFRARLLLTVEPEGGGALAMPAAGPGRRILSGRTVRFLRETLRRVVEDPKGTAHRIAGPGISGFLGGKTGTSHTKGEPRIYTASFCGFWPVGEPRWLALAVLQKKGTSHFYGGRYAAPVVRDLCRFVTSREAAEAASAEGEGAQEEGVGPSSEADIAGFGAEERKEDSDAGLR